MFETVAPAQASSRNRSALYEALTFSIVAHAMAGGFALASSLWEVSFPITSPVYNVAFVLSEVPVPPPPPPPPPKPLAERPEEITNAKLAVPVEMLAPTVIPDEIPVVKQELVTRAAFAVPTGIQGGLADGFDGGVLGGLIGGEPGGKLGGILGGVGDGVGADGRVHVPRDKKLPMIALSQPYPEYPARALIRYWEDELVVRYIIGKDGRVKEVSVVSAPQHDLFVNGTLDAIRTWRFKPFMKDGVVQEVVHEMTVYYRLNVGS
ncbi:MAG TPA: TonB family protein [Thermoanaerobaculia bacterium]